MAPSVLSRHGKQFMRECSDAIGRSEAIWRANLTNRCNSAWLPGRMAHDAESGATKNWRMTHVAWESRVQRKIDRESLIAQMGEQALV
jgi:hypothetical protein